MPAAAASAEPGFTLLEVMLAVTILAIVAVAVYGTFSRTLRSKGIAEEQVEVTHAGRSALGRMAEEITSAFYPEASAGGAIFRSLSGGTESAPLDALVFSALSARPSGSDARDSDQRIISYFFSQRPARMGAAAAAAIEEDARDFFAAFGPRQPRAEGVIPERLLRREKVMITSDAATPLVSPVIFLDNVASLQFRFHDGTTWLDAWDSEDRITYYPRLPRAVAIDLGLYDAKGEIYHFATAVDLPLADTRPGRARSSPAGNPTPQSRGTK
jgi:prepilin-type N-terminal cleavage/methylation domain-containing protein